MSFPMFSRILNPFLMLLLKLGDIAGCLRPTEAARGQQKPFISQTRRDYFGTLN